MAHQSFQDEKSHLDRKINQLQAIKLNLQVSLINCHGLMAKNEMKIITNGLV